MTQTRSSSNRAGGVCDAVLVKGEQAAGPMRLPETRAEDFIDQFNRTYEGVGMRLAPSARGHDQDDGGAAMTSSATDIAAQQKIPGSLKAAGDDVLS